MRKGHFREDLYHRLNVLPLVVPPLRQRPVEDLLDLIRHFLSELTGGRPPRVSGRALDLMMDYRWPGNVRELRNNLERAVVLSGGAGEILPEHLTPSVRGDASTVAPEGGEGLETLEEMERRHIAWVLRAHGGNRSRAAQALAVSRTTLYAKIERYGLEETGR